LNWEPPDYKSGALPIAPRRRLGNGIDPLTAPLDAVAARSAQLRGERQTSGLQLSRLHHPKAGFWIRLCVIVIYPICGVAFRIRWHHLDRMPARGGVIVVINHISYVDTLLMARLMWQTGRVPRFMIKSDVFAKPGLGAIMRGSKQIPVARGTADAAKSLGAAIDALKAGEAVIIYPEGTITRDPQQWPMQAKSGLARLILATPETPVVPVGQWGAQKALGSKLVLLTRRRAEASLGEPLDFSARAGEPITIDALRQVTDQVMRAVRTEVAQLRGQTPPDAFFRPSSQPKPKTG
jgi:1-acyl-sn-glycerol-3-phosphate acyltransferase